MNNAVKQTLLARVYDVAVESPLGFAPKISRDTGVTTFLKREDLQPVHSFKLRGAYNKIVNLTKAEQQAGVIAASAGNHAQGVALAAQKLDLTATVVMPETTPGIKVNAVKSFGAQVVLHGNNYSEAYDHAIDLTKSTKQTFIHPFDDELVIAGQGTIGREILEQLNAVTHIFVPVGGGGLIAGIAQYVKALRPDVKIIGVEPEDSNAMGLSLKAKKRVCLDHVGIFADGVAVKEVGARTFAIAEQYVDEVITVTTDQICSAIKAIFEETRSVLEPAGALAVAGVSAYGQQHHMDGAEAVAICSGANMSFERLQFVAERTLVGSGKEALFAVTLPEKPGALKQFCETVVNGNSISEFNYRMHHRTDATILVGILFGTPTAKQIFLDSLKTHHYAFQDLSRDEIAKEHIRHMIGGKSNDARDERIYQINFPEKPGALGSFLATLGSEFNISLFHYRGLGADTGSVLIGFEAPNQTKLEKLLTSTTYDFQPINTHATQAFL